MKKSNKQKFKIATKDDGKDIILWKRIKRKDDKAKSILLEKYFGLVLLLAHKHHRQGIDFLDLIDVGNLALLKAIEHYDPEYGVTFGHYAKFYINREIKRFMYSKEIIKLPEKKLLLFSKYNRMLSKLYIKYKRLPTMKEIARVLKISESELTKTLKLILPTYSVESIEQPIGIDSNMKVEDTVTLLSEDFSEPIIKKYLMEKAFNMIDRLPREIIKWYYGLEGRPKLTLRKIAKMIGTSAEYVRQTKEKGIIELKNKLISIFGIKT